MGRARPVDEAAPFVLSSEGFLKKCKKETSSAYLTLFVTGYRVPGYPGYRVVDGKHCSCPQVTQANFCVRLLPDFVASDFPKTTRKIVLKKVILPAVIDRVFLSQFANTRRPGSGTVPTLAR